MAGLLVALCAVPARSQGGSVAGTVVHGGTLQPLAGAQVVVEGTGQGTLTDARGRFMIAGLSGPEVTVRVLMIGFRPHTEQVRVGSTTLRVALTEQAIALDEVVVTGTAGAVQRRSIGNVVSRIDAAEVTEVAPVPDMGMMLNSRAPGVVVLQSSGMVGAGARIRIRGGASFSLNDQPLIYVDGVRVNNGVASGPEVESFGSGAISRLNDINPADIESIEVIKGPAAATLYGTEAANGVVHIITKKGRPGDRPRVNLSVRQGAIWFGNAEGRVHPNYWRNPATGEVIEMNLVKLERERGTPIFSTGRLQGYGLEVSGGSEQTRYFVGATYDADNGVEPTNQLRRVSGRMNLSTTLHESLDVSTNLALVRSRTDLSNSQLWHSLRMGHPRFLETPRRGFWSAPPEAIWEARQDYQVLNRFTAGAQLNHRPLSWFSQKLTLGLDLTGEDNQSLFERMEPEVAQFYSPTAALGSKSVAQNSVTYSTLDYSGTATVPLREGLTSSTALGLQYYRNHTQITSANGREFPVEGLKTLDAAAVTFGRDAYFENVTVGVFLQEQFSWQDRVFLTAAVRADDNSAFGENFSLVYYPKASASWVVSEEPFWNVPWVDALRLRAAFGASGQQPETFAALRTYSPVTSGTGAGVVTPQFVGNPDLAPERGEELELGFEASLFADRIGLELTYYNQRTKDAILLQSQPPSLGFPGIQYVNVGEIANSGLELSVNARALRTSRANWEMTMNVSTNHNEVMDLGGQEFIPIGTPAGGIRSGHKVGYPVGAWFQRKAVSAELDANGRAINVMCAGGPENDDRPVPCAEAPVVYLGRSQPAMEGAYSTTLTLFDRLSLYAMVDFKLGYKKDDLTRMARCNNRGICPENIWPERYPAVLQAEFQDPNLFNTHLRIHDASFAKLREISVGYNVPESWAQSFGMSRASLRVGARNLYTWTRWTGLDPETHRMNQLHARSEQDLMPQLQQIVTTLNVTF